MRIALPDPTADPGRLAEAFRLGTDPLRRLPARIAAPLCGLVFRSLLVPVDTTINIWGRRGTFKTALARVHLQHIAPGMRFSNGIKEMVSGASHMSTTKGMATMLGQANDIPVVIDDLAPDRGSAAEARIRLGELARVIYNRSGLTTATRLGSVHASEPLRCSLIFTSESPAGGSTASRCVDIEVGLGAVSADLISAIEAYDAVEARGLIGASYIQWLAEHRGTLLDHDDALRQTYLAGWTSELARPGSGVSSRLAEAAADYSMGVLLLLNFLLHRGVISDEHAEEIWRWSLGGIHEAVEASRPLNSEHPLSRLDNIALARQDVIALLT
jgi:hypothetical protein